MAKFEHSDWLNVPEGESPPPIDLSNFGKSLLNEEIPQQLRPQEEQEPSTGRKVFDWLGERVDKFNSWATGKSQLLEQKEDDTTWDTIGKTVTNVAGEFVRPLAETGARALELPVVPATLKQYSDQEYAFRQFVEGVDADLELAKMLKTIPNTPIGLRKKKIIREHLSHQLYDDIPEPFKLTTFDDVSERQVFWNSVESAATLLVFGTRGVLELKSVNESLRLLGSPVAKGQLALISPLTKGQKALALAHIASVGGLEGMAFMAVATASQPRFDGSSPTWEEYGTNSLIGGAFGAAAYPLLEVGLQRKLWEGNIKRAHEVSHDIAVTAPGRAVHGIDEISGYRRQVDVNVKGTKISKLAKGVEGTDAPGTQPGSFATAKLGDTVRTASGARGVIVRFSGTSTTEQAAERLDDVYRRITGIENTIAEVEDGLFLQSATPERIAKDPLLNKLYREQEALNRELMDILTEPSNLDAKGRPIKQVTLAATDAKRPGRVRYVNVPETELTKGGVVRLRTSLIPEEAGGRLAQVSGDVEASQVQTPRAVMRDPKTGISSPIARPASPSTEEELMAGLRQRFSFFNEDLRKRFEPKKLTWIESVFFDESRGFNLSGLDYRWLQDAEARMGEYVAGLKAEIRPLVEDVLVEAGIPKSKIGRALKPGAIQKLEDLNQKLFRAADKPVRDATDLTPAQQRLVNKWQNEIAPRIWEDTQNALIAVNKKPSEGRPNYITHVVTDAARAWAEYGGGAPEDVMRLMKGGSFFDKPMLEQVSNVLLQRRGDVLPIKEDFFGAMETALRVHGKFIHLAPEHYFLKEGVHLFKETLGDSSAFKANVGHMQKVLNKIAGKSDQIELVRNINRRMLGWAATNKYLKKHFGQDVTLFEQTITVPADNVLVRTVTELTPYNLARRLKSSKYAVDLGASFEYFITNLTQPWALMPAKLRGKFGQRYADMSAGYAKMLGELLNYSKNRRMWQDAGLLTEVDNFIEHEFGHGRAGGIAGLLGRKGGISKMFGMVSEVSEFMNRVASYHAANYNLMRDVRNGTQYWKQLSDLSGEDLRDTIAKLSRDLSNETQFRYGITHRAQIQDDPLGSLFDQYNTFFRKYAGQVWGMWRKLRDSLDKTNPEILPDVKAAFEAWEKGNLKPMAKVMLRISRDERGELIRFGVNATALGYGMHMLGGSYFTEFFFGGIPRYLDSAHNMLWGGIIEDNEEAWNRGVNDLMPPSFKLVQEGAPDVVSFFRDPKLPPLKRWVFEPYNPLRKPAQSFQALRAAVTGKPTPIIDPDTGMATKYIDPDDAMSVFFFGYRSLSEQERFGMLTELSMLRAKQTNDQQKRGRQAQDMLDELMSTDLNMRSQALADMVMEGKFGTTEKEQEEMAKLMLDRAYSSALMEDAIDRNMSNLAPEYRAPFLMESIFPLTESKEERERIINKYYLGGQLTEEMAMELVKWKMKKDDSPRSTIDWVKEKLEGIGLLGAAGGALVASRGRVNPKVEKTVVKAISKLKGMKPAAMTDRLLNDGSLGEVIVRGGEHRAPGHEKFTLFIEQGESGREHVRKVTAFMDLLNEKKVEEAGYLALDLPLPLSQFDENIARQAVRTAEETGEKVSNVYLSGKGLKYFAIASKANPNRQTVTRLSSEGTKKRQEVLSTIRDRRIEKAQYRKELAELSRKGVAPVGAPLVTSIQSNLRQLGATDISRDFIMKGLGRTFANVGKVGWRTAGKGTHHHTFAERAGAETMVTKEDLSEMFRRYMSETLNWLSDRDFDDLAEMIIEDVPNFSGDRWVGEMKK